MPALLARELSLVEVSKRGPALTGVTQSAEDGLTAGYNGFQSLSLSKGQIAAVALAIVITFGLLVFALWYACIRHPANRRKRRLQQNREASGIRMRGGGGPSMRMAKRGQDDDDDRSFMSESTLHGDGPTVPLVAAAGGEERRAAAARRYGQPISWSGSGSGGQYGRI